MGLWDLPECREWKLGGYGTVGWGPCVQRGWGAWHGLEKWKGLQLQGWGL